MGVAKCRKKKRHSKSKIVNYKAWFEKSDPYRGKLDSGSRTVLSVKPAHQPERTTTYEATRGKGKGFREVPAWEAKLICRCRAPRDWCDWGKWSSPPRHRQPPPAILSPSFARSSEFSRRLRRFLINTHFNVDLIAHFMVLSNSKKN